MHYHTVMDIKHRCLVVGFLAAFVNTASSFELRVSGDPIAVGVNGSCAHRCHPGLDLRFDCQCNTACFHFQDCCSDFKTQCHLKPGHADGASVGTQCPLGWTFFDGECLYFSIHDTRSWYDALAYCRTNHNSYLATIDNEPKNNYIREILSILSGEQVVHWVGGMDRTTEGQWTWEENGRPIGPFTNWGAGYPANTTVYHDCMVTNLQNGTLVWRDRDCYYHYNFICEYQAFGGGQIVG